MNFGELLRTYRLKKEITLREFANMTEIDSAYLSRVERGTISPPQKEQLLTAIIEALELTKEEAQILRDQAATENKAFPEDVAEKVKQVPGIPMLLRTVANKKLTPEEMERIIKYINSQY
jgi:transcriptional regulator with XRE-family HTH domain